MEGIADTGIAELGMPASVVGAIAILAIFAGLAAARVNKAIRHREQSNPLGGLFDASTFDSQLRTIAERSANMPPRPISSPAPALHGQRAQYARLCEVWERDTREEAIEQIARVMRASMDAAPAPLKVVKADPVFDAIEWQAQCEAEWEEIKLLPPPASSPASQAA